MFLFKPVENNNAILWWLREVQLPHLSVFTRTGPPGPSQASPAPTSVHVPSNHNSSLEFSGPLWAPARGCRVDVPEDHESSGKAQEGPWGCGGSDLIVMIRTLWNRLTEGRVLVTSGPGFCPFLSETVVLWLSSIRRENPSLRLGAWSQSKATYNNPVVLIFGARGNARLSSLAGMFFISSSESTHHSGTSGRPAQRQSKGPTWWLRLGYNKQTKSSKDQKPFCCQSCDLVKTHRKFSEQM